MCARRFLIAVAILTLLAVAGAFAMFQFGSSMLRDQFTPQGHYVAPPPSSGPDYSNLDNWLARPGIANDPSWWRPGTEPRPLATRPAHAFYVHPTTYLQGDRWNAAIRPGGDTEFRTRLFTRSQASALADVATVWAPRYRQAAYGAFLLDSEDSAKSLALAYSDVSAAFAEFLKQVPAGEPIILAGHSQGALHLLRLLEEHKAQLQGRLAAAYVVGWPISATADLPALGFPECRSQQQSGCILSWLSFAEPANPSLILKSWEASQGVSGGKRRREDVLCVNPITGSAGTAASPAANPGTLVPASNFTTAELVPGAVGARCDDGLLVIDGEIPALGPFVLPGNNYHVYDFALFWSAIQRDARQRVQSWRP